MKLQIKFLWGIFLLCCQLYAQPLVRTINNLKTPFEFTIVAHNDFSDCSPLKNNKVVKIKPYSIFKQQLLLSSEKLGLLLRPSGFYDHIHKIMYSFLDKDGNIDKKKLEKAFEAWKKIHNKRYKKSVDAWFAQWLCGDISLIHNHVEIFGYLLNISIARIDNEKNYHACTIDYSEGLFSRQIIDIIIDQKSNKGIIPHVKSFVGQGGLCQDGQIVSI